MLKQHEATRLFLLSKQIKNLDSKKLMVFHPYLLFAVFTGGSKIVTYNFGWGGGGWGGVGGVKNCNLQFLTP